MGAATKSEKHGNTKSDRNASLSPSGFFCPAEFCAEAKYANEKDKKQLQNVAAVAQMPQFCVFEKCSINSRYIANDHANIAPKNPFAKKFLIFEEPSAFAGEL